MELNKSSITNDCDSATNSHPQSMTTTLPSLFGDHVVNGGSLAAAAASKDMDGLINDSALSQQIEFILQDAPVEHHEGHDDHDGDGAMMDASSSTDLGDAHAKLDNPPTTNVVTSASEYTSSGVHAPNADAMMATHQDNHLLNERRIIFQTAEAAGILPALTANEMNLPDPELNDENLQDIAEEAQDVDEDEEEEQLKAHIKIEQNEESEIENHLDEMDFINASTLAHHAQLSEHTQEIVLPAGSIMSEALAQYHRRPVYISNAVGGISGTAYVRMPSVMGRTPMAVLNVVQQGVGSHGGQTTQLVLQAAPMGNQSSPVVVSPAGTSSLSAPISVTTNGEIAVAPPAAQAQLNQMLAAAPSAPATTAPTPSTSTTVAAASTSSANTSALPTMTTTFQCFECVEKFESKELFDIHRSGHANNMKCAICNMVLKSLKNYEKHCLRCKPYECQICGRVVRFRPNFIKHMRVHTGQQSERHKYKCDVCHKEFMSFEYFKVHKKIHNENVNLTCEICGKVFSALASLRGHSKLHSGVKLHKCDVCGKGFGQRYNLKIHARTHTGDFPFECKVCKKKLHTQTSLQTHMQVHQREQNAQITTTATATTTSTTATTSAAGNSATFANVSSATVVKLESNSNGEEPSTSGLQSNNLQQQQQQQQQRQQQQQQMLRIANDDEMDGNSTLSEGDTPMVSTTLNRIQDDSSNSISSNGSQELRSQNLMFSQTQPQTRTIVFRNYMQDDNNSASRAMAQQQNVIHANAGGTTINGTALQQQMQRKTPIIHSVGGAATLSSALASVVQAGTSPSPSPSSSSTSCSSSVVVSKTGAPLSLASAAIGTSTIRSTRNVQPHHHLGPTLSNQSQNQSNNHHRSLQRNNNHRNHHRRHHSNDLDDDDDDDDEDVRHAHRNLNNRLQLHHNGRHFDDDDDDEKSSPSLATAAIIKVEPNLYSSGSGDNSNEMLIKEEVMFEDSADPNSPHSPPSSKFHMSYVDNDLVDHHVDLNNSLPPYGYLFEPHSIPDNIPVQLYPDDEDDFRLDHSSLGGLNNTSSSTTDGDFIKKEWVYGAGSSYAMNGKFDDDSEALCDSGNFICN